MAEKNEVREENTQKTKEMRKENIQKVREVITSEKLSGFISQVGSLEGGVKKLKSAFEEKLKTLVEERKAKELLEESKVQQEQTAKTEKVVETPVVVEEKPAKKQAEKPVQPAEPKIPIAQEKTQEKTDEKVEKSSEPVEKPAKPVVSERPAFIVRREGPINRDNERKPRAEYRPQREFKPAGDTRGERPERQGAGFNKGAKPDFNRTGAPRKPQAGGTFVAPAVIPTAGSDKRGFAKKKQNGGDRFEEKHTINKRALIKNQVDVDDFDENKSGYRKFRPVKKQKNTADVNVIKIEKAVMTTEIIPLKVLSEKIGVTAAEITKKLFKEGIMKTINDSIDFDTAAFIADDFGVELELKLDKTAEDVLSEGFDEVADNENLVKRPPVVTVMGHVDHGKTSILDRIRKTNVTAGEAGGITQHIGAYQVTAGGETITFLDTPGHAAFTAMRARGAQATDVAILVVAADDGIMPQTVEAISHAKAADVPIIVAINKIDKPEANIDRIKTQLTDNGLLPEEWGGDAILCPVSAKTGEGFENLLENINLVAEMRDLKANPDRKAKGVVIEAKLDQGKGPIATILVQNGTLKIADSVIVGTVTGKIRAMVDDKGRRVTSAGPSMPVSIMGLDEVPNSGDILFAVEQEKLTKLVAEERKNKERENMIKASQTVTLDDVFNKIAEGGMKGLNIIVKADVQGSVEAVKQSLEKLSNEEVKVRVIHAAAGAINESDIMLAESSGAIIIGFNVRPDSNAKQIAERSGVDIKLYRVIYEAIEDVEKALKGMLAPKFTEVYLGKAEVREVFKISGVGQVAGSYVVEGKISRNCKLRIYRDDVMICEGDVHQLKRFKDDVKEVAQGFECGISIERFNDIKVGDFIECYQVEENKA